MRAEGARSLFFKALGETVYRRLTIVELDLMDPPPLDAASLPLDFGFLAESEAAGLAVLEVPPGPAEAVERLRRGERCFVARHDRRIVSARWLATGRTAHIDYLDQELRLERGDVYLYEAFTHPDYRGRGISAAAGTRLARRLAVDGARRILAAVLPENRPGVRAFEKAGFRAVGTVGWIGLGGRRHEFLRAGTGCYG